MSTTLLDQEVDCKPVILYRQYQQQAIDETLRLFSEDVTGVLIRSFTGSGKGLIAAGIADRWQELDEKNRVFGFSFDSQLRSQVGEEIARWTGIPVAILRPGDKVPSCRETKIFFSTRQMVAPKKPATDEQRQFLKSFNIEDIGVLTSIAARKCVNHLRRGIDPENVKDFIARFNQSRYASKESNAYGLLYAFDAMKYNWLCIYDEAHRFAAHLKQVKPIYEHFSLNPLSRRLGLTATPRRFDQVSIGHKMFPGVSLDLPLCRRDGQSAIGDGYAVGSKVVHIVHEGIDFREVKRDKGGNYDATDMDYRLRDKEEGVGKCVQPLLDLSGDRLTIAFCVSVEFAKEAAAYVNARTKCRCVCGSIQWHQTVLIGDGAMCAGCNRLVKPDDSVSDGRMAEAVYGSMSHEERERIYAAHAAGEFQVLFACNLCIAKDSLILTDQGEVPIQNVAKDMRLWDGVEFVAHDGVVFKGHRPVIEYAGLKATGDHDVWTAYGWRSLANCKQRGLAIAVSGIGGRPVREIDRCYRNDDPQRTTATFGSRLRRLWQNVVAAVLSMAQWLIGMPHMSMSSTQSKREPARVYSGDGREDFLQQIGSHHRKSCQGRQSIPIRLGREMHRLRQGNDEVSVGIEVGTSGLQKLREIIRYSRMVTLSMQSCQTAMQQFGLYRLQGLWGPRDRNEVLHDAGDGALDHAASRIARISDDRSNRQQWALRTWQPAICDAERTGEESPQATEDVYDILNSGPRHRFTANGLIVSNCREGFDSPRISCVGILRPVSKKASSLLEQMIGRGARPLKGIIEGLPTAEARLAAIAASAKKDFLVIDVIGHAGNEDSASVIDIYAEGLDDEVRQAAQAELLANNGMSAEEAIQIAIEKIETAREKRRKQHEADQAERERIATERAKLGAQFRYTATEIKDQVSAHVQRLYRGEVRMATDKQLRYLYKLGFRDIDQYDRPSLRQAGRMIEQLQKGESVDDVRYTNKLVGKADAYAKRISTSASNEELNKIGMELKAERGIDPRDWEMLVANGKTKRAELMT